jgi:hypothetical protein
VSHSSDAGIIKIYKKKFLFSLEKYKIEDFIIERTKIKKNFHPSPHMLTTTSNKRMLST